MSDNKLKILIDEKTLVMRIKELADDINKFYGTDDELTIVCVLKGAVMFFCELAKYLKMPIRMEFVGLSSYDEKKKSSGKVSALNLST